MGRGINFTAQETRTILEMKHKGYKYSEIAEKVGRSAKSISVFCQRNRLVVPRKDSSETKAIAIATNSTTVQQEEAKFLGSAEVEVDNEIVGTITPMPSQPKAYTVSTEPMKQFVETKTLEDMKSREMIKILYDRGYRIKPDGTLICLIEKPVMLKEILGQ